MEQAKGNERAVRAELTAGGGELGERIRDFDWAATELGPVAGWPAPLRTALRIVLTAHQPMVIWWGESLLHLYNDQYRAVLGGKHPWALGRPAQDVWREIWHEVGPRTAQVMQGATGTYDEALLLVLERYGFKEETYFRFSYSPIPNEDGSAGGVFCACNEETQTILSQRELALLSAIGNGGGGARTAAEACRAVAAAWQANGRRDFPFALLYRAPGQGAARLEGAAGITPGQAAAPVELGREASVPWPLGEVLERGAGGGVREAPVPENARRLKDGPWPQALRQAAMTVLPSAEPVVLVAGLSPLRPWNEGYRQSFARIAHQAGNCISHAEAYAEQQHRAQELADLDRAKTVFFTNISHEFRTPLTLILGPGEDALADREQPLGPKQRRRVELIEANAQRLLQLVNALLDFARAQAGRMDARFAPVDLGKYTAELASAFRSAAEKAGLELVVRMGPLARVYVDADLWQKIVFNLLSNALKYTPAGGRITVRAGEREGKAELTVEDTGNGIPPSAQERIFERFQRVEGAAGRSHEGSGIGLALTKELVGLHGGTIGVESELGRGSRFTVTLPLGKAHLPAERVVKSAAPAAAKIPAGLRAEAHRWEGREETAAGASQGEAGADAARVLLVEDNADMRAYLAGLLSPRYRVEAVHDGTAGLRAAREHPPDLVLSDIMMPGLDGFGLLAALRGDERTRALPVVLLSARAGEEARTDGMEAGADDYLVKPFTARELLARVGAHVSMHRVRQDMAARERQLREQADAAEARYRYLVETMAEGLMAVDWDWKVRYLNPQAAAMAGRPPGELLGENIWDLFPIAGTVFEAPYRRAHARRQPEHVEGYFAPLDMWVEVDVHPVRDGLVFLAKDMTMQRRREAELLEFEKLAAAGRTAANLAHEINNPLSAVMNLLYLARCGSEAKRERRLKTAERELGRVAALARQSLTFFRGAGLPARLDVEEAVTAMVELMADKLRGRGIQVETDLAAGAQVLATETELQQVILNLLLNAYDAMPEGGRLRITLAAGTLEGQPGWWLRVGDTGQGIRPEDRLRLGEPFFTTKGEGGTGLGLWTVRQIVAGHGGRLELSGETPEPGRGAAITVWLPQAKAAA